jgi:glycosyltransferase involved in cell wall biosynthesis
MVRQVEPVLLGLRKGLAELGRAQFDLVHFIHPQAAKLLNMVDVPAPKTLDWVDERSNTLERSLAWKESAAARWATRMEIRRIQAYQRQIGRLFEATFSSSAMDADRLAALAACSRPTVVANGVDTIYFDDQDQFGSRQTAQLLFSGHMGYEPNIDAISYLWDEIWPLIIARVPGAHLLIVGTDPGEEVLQLAREHPEQVSVTGRVEDVRPYLAQSTVCLAPLRSGSGTRLKILEAMAMRRPVVSTSIGCEGLDVEDRESIFIGDTPTEFAEAVVELLESEAAWKKVSENGRRLVVERYGWEQLARPMARVWRELIERS